MYMVRSMLSMANEEHSNGDGSGDGSGGDDDFGLG